MNYYEPYVQTYIHVWMASSEYMKYTYSLMNTYCYIVVDLISELLFIYELVLLCELVFMFELVHILSMWVFD